MRSPRQQARFGLGEIENAVVYLLRGHPEGLTNVEIAEALGIESKSTDEHRNYLSWSVLIRLSRAGRVEKVSAGKRKVLYRIKKT
jgi:FixJ family two-component response regulator